jgi:hypothetical protein
MKNYGKSPPVTIGQEGWWAPELIWGWRRKKVAFGISEFHVSREKNSKIWSSGFRLY